MMEVLLRESWKSKKSLHSRTNYPTEFLLNFPRLKMVGCLTLGPKGEGVKIQLVRNLLVPNMVKSVWGNCRWEQVISLVVESVDIRLGIVP